MSDYAPCPRCGASAAEKVGFTWWGGLLGPKLFSHVKCRQCGATYNGKTGRSNAVPIAIYIVVSGLLVLAVGAALFFSQMR